ncbi:cation transporter [Desulfosporosinus acidiphilus]|uniref:cation transporter n=1 Tax=Desulfosporosinus acidiphilus TaxID=885581 RepID=UPI003CFCE305
MNVRSAVFHMLSDAAASGGVIIGGIIIIFTKWYIIDPILSILIALLIAVGAWRIIKQTVNFSFNGRDSLWNRNRGNAESTQSY